MHTITANVAGVDVTMTERGAGNGRDHAVLVLHGGGGPATVEEFAKRLAIGADRHVLIPVHPGFNGTPRPDSLTTVAGLAQLYVGLVEELDLTDVTVVGNSIGGWIAAEMALLPSDRIGRVVIVNGAGLQVDSAPIVDFFSLTPAEVTDLSYYDPEKFRINPATLPEQVRAAIAGNRATLGIYAGTGMADPTLEGRLAGAHVPALVVWGAADRVVPVEHGRTYARAIPDARFELITNAGHMPQLETPDTLLKLVLDFADAGRR